MVGPAELIYGALGGVGFAAFAMATVQFFRGSRNGPSDQPRSYLPSGGGGVAKESGPVEKAQTPTVKSEPPVKLKEKSAGSRESE